MDLTSAIILGIIQGITEWLPVSSSGHLVILQHYLGVSPPLSFDIMLHVATFFVVMLIFWRDISGIIEDVIIKRNFKSKNAVLTKFLVIASIPTAILGIFFDNFFETMFSNPLAVGIALLINGAILYTTKFAKEKKNLDTKKSLLIGLAQGISITPGISRSGMTISSALLSGIDKETAIKFSFLLFIPAAIGGTIFKFSDLTATLTNDLIIPTIISSITAFLVGYLSLKFLIDVIRKQRFYYFSYYCFIVGLIVIFFH